MFDFTTAKSINFIVLLLIAVPKQLNLKIVYSPLLLSAFVVYTYAEHSTNEEILTLRRLGENLMNEKNMTLEEAFIV